MSITERPYVPISGRPTPGGSTAVSDDMDGAAALPGGVVGGAFSWPIQLLAAPRREPMYALYAFRRELEDIADGGASRSLKQTLLSNWRGEIARLYEGRPQHAVTSGLNEAIHRYSL